MSPPRHPWVVGVDLGGSNLRVAVYRDLGAAAAAARTAGRALAQAPAAVIRRPVGSDRSVETIIERIAAAVRDVLAEVGASPVAVVPVGIGLAAMLADRRGTVANSPHLGWRDVAFGPALARRLGPARPVGVYNDVNAITYGEFGVGAGAGARDLLCVFVGTGIGGGLVIDGQLYRGATGTAGEIGHIVVDAGGRHCGCGQRGCLEAYASRSAITRTLLGEIQRGRPSVLRELLAGGEPGVGSAAIRSGLIAQAVAANDELTMSVLDEAAAYLGIGLASAINLVNPWRIILGGGLIEAVDFFFEAVSRNARQGALPVPGGQIEIVRTGLGDNSGVVGAAVMAAETATR